MALKAQKDKPSREHRASKSGLTKADGGIDGLHWLATSFGAATFYVDEGAGRRQVTDQSLSRILAVMGVQVETPEQVCFESRSGRWRELVERLGGVRVDRLPYTFAFRLPVDLDELSLCITEDRVRGQALAGVCLFCRFTLQWQQGSL
jgi:hypothetical protein